MCVQCWFNCFSKISFDSLYGPSLLFVVAVVPRSCAAFKTPRTSSQCLTDFEMVGWNRKCRNLLGVAGEIQLI